MVKDICGKKITPGMYQDDSDHLYQVFEDKNCLMLRSQRGYTGELETYPLELRRVEPNETLQGLEKIITWIQKYFPETIQNPPNSQPFNSSNPQKTP